MRELIERFSYRFQLWQRERYGDYSPADPTARNPLRYVAAVAMFWCHSRYRPAIPLSSGATSARSGVHSRVTSVSSSLLPFLEGAWYVCVGWLIFGFLAYWILYLAGYAPYQLRPRQPSVFVVVIPHIILTGALIGWFFWVRERYFRFIRDAS